MIISAAVIINGKVESLPRPARHHTILHAFPNEPSRHRGEQGFIDDRQGFVGRHEALCLALACKQELISGEFWAPEHGLFSEDLW